MKYYSLYTDIRERTLMEKLKETQLRVATHVSKDINQDKVLRDVNELIKDIEHSSQLVREEKEHQQSEQNVKDVRKEKQSKIDVERSWTQQHELEYIENKKEHIKKRCKEQEVERAYRKRDSGNAERYRSGADIQMRSACKLYKTHTDQPYSWELEDPSDLDDVFNPGFGRLQINKGRKKQIDKKLNYKLRHANSMSDLTYDITSDSDLGDDSKGKSRPCHNRYAAPRRHSHCCCSQSGLPPLKLPTFSGNPLEFRQFKMQFESMVAHKVSNMGDRLSYLQECVNGQAATLLKHMWDDGPKMGYKRAWKILNETYDDPRVIADAYIEQIVNWKEIYQEDVDSLKEFSELLKRSLLEKNRSTELEALDCHSYLVTVMNKLPGDLQYEWLEYVVNLKRKGQKFPLYKNMVDFVEYHSDIANDPLFGRKTYKQDGPISSADFSGSTGSHIVSSYATAKEQQLSKGKCYFCNALHFLDACPMFMEKPLAKRKTFIISNRLCFACLRPGHLARQCIARLTCDTCGKRHATCLHYSKHKFCGNPLVQTQLQVDMRGDVETACVSGRQMRARNDGSEFEPTVYKPVVPVLVRKAGNQQTVKTYALLDDCSSSCFVADYITEQLQVEGIPTELKLRTLHGSDISNSKYFTNLEISNLVGEQLMELPKTFSRPTIGIDNICIPKREVVAQWPHLRCVASKLTENDTDADIGLILGANCTGALEPSEIVASGGTGLFAANTLYGWTVQGSVSKSGTSCENQIVNL